jgi:predicted nicotinamide N-methyase
VSIHRFEGYPNLIQRQKIVVWSGFSTYFRFTPETFTITYADFLAECQTFMQQADTCECVAIIHVTGSTVVATIIDDWLPAGPTNNDFRIRRVDHNIEENSIKVELYVQHKSHQPSMKNGSYWKYKLPDGQIISTREPMANAGLKIKNLLSNKLVGCDNTGNICVWPSENIMLYTLLTNPVYTALVRGKRILEVGGGLTALAGLGLAISNICSEVCITDGHPECVINHNVCIKMYEQARNNPSNNEQRDSETPKQPLQQEEGVGGSCNSQQKQKKCLLFSSVLHWSPDRNAADMEFILTHAGDSLELQKPPAQRRFDVVLASDCLFFREFHLDLIATLTKVLVPGGLVLLLQPARDGSMQLFLQRAVEAETGPFEVHSIEAEQYCPQIREMRERYRDHSNVDTGYNEDVHHPIMIALRLK